MKAVRSPSPGARSSRGVSDEKGGSLMTAMRKPASVNASDIACKGRCRWLNTKGEDHLSRTSAPRHSRQPCAAHRHVRRGK